MADDLIEQLDSIPPATRSLLDEFGFDREWFLGRAARIEDAGTEDNIVTGTVTPPEPGDVIDLPPRGSAEHENLTSAGIELLSEGRCALVVLAGGMATRMGGVVKALVEALPGMTFLDIRLAAHRNLEERAGRRIPLWLMTSHATDAATRQALGDLVDGYNIATFPQMVSLRLNPDGSLFVDDTGEPSLHAPGHGDLPDALRRSGLLAEFRAAGGTVVTTANLDNLGATPDPALIGLHHSSGAQVTCEVVEKVGSDRGGIPARLDDRPLILEEFRIPPTFDPTQVGVFNTNTFHFDARALDELAIDWTYFAVPKEVEGQSVIQFERLINEVAAHLDTRFVRVPRDGGESRFLPVKDNEDLVRKRPAIEAVARHQGVI